MKVCNTAERLKKIMAERGLRQVDVLQAAEPFCKKYNVRLAKNDLSQYVSGKVEPGQEKLTMLGLALNVSEAWLMGYDVPMEREKKSPTAKNISPIPEFVQKPRLGAIACGRPILAEQNIEGYDAVPDWVKCDFTLVCKGDSMIGARIRDGDVVCIKAQPTVENGQIAAVLIDAAYDEEATLKRVRYTDGGIVLWPENPAYEPMSFTGTDAERVHILGIATHFISNVL